MKSQDHWNRVYQTKSDDQVSWFEPSPALSLRLLRAAGLTDTSCVIDIGGGDSRLVDHLVSQGLDCIAVLDVSSAALGKAKTRLGAASAVARWIEADVTGDWSLDPIDIWHDRAVFHFLVDQQSRERYRAHLRSIVKPGGGVVIATFAPDGPDKCSGLPVVKYSPEMLAAEMSDDLTLIESVPYSHVTPWGISQAFQYSRFEKH